MKALLLISAGIVAAGAVAAPAFAGLNDNPSFSHQIPIRVPSQAQVRQTVDDHGSDSRPAPSPSPTSVRTPSRHAEPGDDRGGDRTSGSREPEPGDDHGGDTTHAEPGDDHGGDTRHAEPGDDHGGHSGRGGDDSGSHG
jgi:hypothetical protein